MVKTVISVLAFFALLAGCGRIDETQDNNTVVENLTDAYNCLSDTPTNSYGCYDSDVRFPGATGDKLTDGVWSVYEQSNTNRTDGITFYDRYQRGFIFSGDGSAYKQERTDGYSTYRTWGVNDAGTAVSVSDEGKFTYAASFSGQDGCFQISNDGATLKLCHESFVNSSQENSTGYYGSTVRFGNLTNYNFTAVGTWTVEGYGENDAVQASVTLDANGTTSNGGEWGVSADGKVMGIDGTRYLVYQYLERGDCIAVFELSGGFITPTQWKLCRQ